MANEIRNCHCFNRPPAPLTSSPPFEGTLMKLTMPTNREFPSDFCHYKFHDLLKYSRKVFCSARAKNTLLFCLWRMRDGVWEPISTITKFYLFNTMLTKVYWGSRNFSVAKKYLEEYISHLYEEKISRETLLHRDFFKKCPSNFEFSHLFLLLF